MAPWGRPGWSAFPAGRPLGCPRPPPEDPKAAPEGPRESLKNEKYHFLRTTYFQHFATQKQCFLKMYVWLQCRLSFWRLGGHRSVPKSAPKGTCRFFMFLRVAYGACVEHAMEKCLSHALLHSREAMFAPKVCFSRNLCFPAVKPMILASLSEREVQTRPPVGPQGPPRAPQGVPRRLLDGPFWPQEAFRKPETPEEIVPIRNGNCKKTCFCSS